MSFYSAFVANHLNKNDAGNPKLLEFPNDQDGLSAKMKTEKAAIVLICMGFGLARFKT